MSANRFAVILAVTTSVLFAGCEPAEGPEAVDVPAADASGKAESGTEIARSTGKPTAPITLEYDVIGSAIVGQPVGISLRVGSDEPGLPVTLHYRILDSAALVFAESQPQRVAMTIEPDENPRLTQITVVPQREGRLYVNVSAEVETENGTLLRAMAIPVQVGAAPSSPAVNGELKQTADGETVVSMPAEEGR